MDATSKEASWGKVGIPIFQNSIKLGAFILDARVCPVVVDQFVEKYNIVEAMENGLHEGVVTGCPAVIVDVSEA
jgi:hypothetical protein